MALVTSQKLDDAQTEKLQKLIDSIDDIVAAAANPQYDEIYGYRIAKDGEQYVDVAVRNEILLKFLIAAEWEVDVAQKKVTATLDWRLKFKVLSAAYREKYDPELEKMGVITHYTENKNNFRVATWNLYANLKNPKKLFSKFGVDGDNKQGDELEGTMFLRWRVGLMERALLLLQFGDADNTKIAQVHDYNNVSMFRMDPGMKAATKQIIHVFSENYPELLSKKYFINVPLLMGWVFTFFKATGFMTAATLSKFEMLSSGDLSVPFGKANLPKDYNGGVANENVESIFTLAVNDIKTPEYAEVILAKFFEQTVATPVDSVD